MSQPADHTRFLPQARVGCAIEAVVEIERGQIDIEDAGAVERDRDLRAVSPDLLRVPFAGPLKKTPLGRGDAVERAMRLVGLEIAVERIGVVDHLQFVPEAAVAAKIKPVVGSRRKFDVKPEHKIGQLAPGVGNEAAVADQRPILHAPARAMPTGERLPIEEAFKALGGLFGGHPHARLFSRWCGETRGRQPESEAAGEQAPNGWQVGRHAD